MKLFFKFDLEFTYIAHAFAMWLKAEERVRDEDLRGMAFGRFYHDWLTRGQTDIRYAHVSLHQDVLNRALSEPPDVEFLTRMEADLGADTLWRLFDADRSVQHFSYAQALSVMTIALKYFLKEFTEHRPDAVISFVTGSTNAMACYLVARHLRIPYIEFAATRLQRRALVTTTPMYDFPEVQTAYREFLDGRGDPRILREAEDLVRTYRHVPAPPDGQIRARELYDHAMALTPRRLLGWLRINYWWYFGHYKHDLDIEPPVKHALRVLRTRFLRGRVLRSAHFGAPVPTERFAYFPLHLQPELSTMVLSPFWLDQPSLVQNIARSLPVGMRLYVKEHVPMLGFRPLDYYERLRAIPNVRLIDPYFPSLELIQRADLVLTITGTAGFEAMLLGRPVIVFSDVSYSGVDGVRRCQAPEDLPSIIRMALACGPATNRHVHAHVAALLKESFEFDMDQLWYPERPYESVRDNPTTRRLYEAYFGVFDRVTQAEHHGPEGSGGVVAESLAPRT